MHEDEVEIGDVGEREEGLEPREGSQTEWEFVGKGDLQGGEQRGVAALTDAEEQVSRVYLIGSLGNAEIDAHQVGEPTRKNSCDEAVGWSGDGKFAKLVEYMWTERRGRGGKVDPAREVLESWDG